MLASVLKTRMFSASERARCQFLCHPAKCGPVSTRILCGSGRDLLEGVGGNDTLSGGFGEHNIAGGLHEDTINGVFRDDAFDHPVGPDRWFGGQCPAPVSLPVTFSEVVPGHLVSPGLQQFAVPGDSLKR